MTVLGPRESELKASFIAARGFWHEFLEQMLVLDPDYFEAYTNFSSVPWRNGPLEPKFKELIYVALNANATHLFAPGLRAHIRNALTLGATQAEILEVLQLVSVVGIHTLNVGLPILAEELEAHQSRADG